MIDLSHDLPAAPAERPDDGAVRRRPQAPQRGQGQPGTSSPGDAALIQIVKLLARQAAEQDISQGHKT